MASPPANRKATNLAMPPSIDAALYSNVGRYAGAAVLTVFEQIGGVQAMSEWAQKNPSEFYKGPFAKIISSPKEISVTGRVTIEEAVKALDLEEGVGYTVVEDEPDIDEEQF